MLPLLPAILLLLLQGPSNVERLAAQGRLPAALNAVYGTVGETPTLREAEQVVLASLLAAGEDPRLSDALLAIFRMERERREAPPAPTGELQVRPDVGDDVRLPREGFERSQRVRDGPR
ncbi:MAG: hypothetical protein ACO1SV_04210 [Fimbriimonas sp.]